MNRALPAILACALASSAWAAPEPDQVSMSLGEFLRLYEQSKNRPEKPEKAPRAYTLSSARYDGEVVFDDDEPTSAVFTARFRVEVLKDKGWVRVPLLPNSVALQSAKIGGQEAPVVLEGGQYILTTDKQGSFEVVAKFAVGVSSGQGQAGFQFPLMPAGATEMTLSVPVDEDLDFTVANARLKQDRIERGKRVVEATLPSQGTLAVSWQREIQEAEEQPARLYSEVHTLMGVGEGVLRANVTVQETILFNGIDQVQVKVPTDMTVLDVRGNGLRDWAVAEDGTLTAQLNYEAEGSYSLMLDLEKVVADASDINVPIVEPLGVERNKGFVGVQALGALEIKEGAVSGAASVDVRMLPGSILGVTDNPVLLGYKYLGGSPAIPLTVSEHDEVDVLVTLVDQAVATTMFTEDGRRITSVTYQVRNNRRQFLRLALPEGAELWSASVAGRSVQPALGGDGRLMLPLVRSAAAGGALAAFDVSLVYVEDGSGPDSTGRGTFKATLPTPDAPSTYVGWVVYAPDEAKVGKKSYDGTLKYAEYGLTRPLDAVQVLTVDAYQEPMQQAAQGMANHGGMGGGAAPVQVSLPVQGIGYSFEKLLALDEELWVSFDYKGLK